MELWMHLCMYVSLGVCPFEVPVPVVVEAMSLRGLGAQCLDLQSQHCAAANQINLLARSTENISLSV